MKLMYILQGLAMLISTKMIQKFCNMPNSLQSTPKNASGNYREKNTVPQKCNSQKKKGFCAVGTQGDIIETIDQRMKIRKHLQVNPLHTYFPEMDTISFRYISFQMACQSDSGGAAIWDDEEEHRSFVIGINDSGGVDS